MALPSYPAGLNHKPTREKFRVDQPTRPPKWTEFEDGPPLGRRSGASRRSQLPYQIVFDTPAEFDRFRVFHETDLVDGTSRFTMPVYIPKTDTYEVRTVMIDQGTYTADPFGLGYAVSFTLIVFNW